MAKESAGRSRKPTEKKKDTYAEVTGYRILKDIISMPTDKYLECLCTNNKITGKAVTKPLGQAVTPQRVIQKITNIKGIKNINKLSSCLDKAQLSI